MDVSMVGLRLWEDSGLGTPLKSQPKPSSRGSAKNTSPHSKCSVSRSSMLVEFSDKADTEQNQDSNPGLLFPDVVLLPR